MQAAEERVESAVNRTKSESYREVKNKLCAEFKSGEFISGRRMAACIRRLGVVVTIASVKNQSVHRKRLRF